MTETFDEELFETRLEALKDTQEGIQQMSNWCLQHRSNHKKIIQCWLNVFKRVRVDHRLVLFYLANDVIQYSKRKRYEFVECWATALQRATTMVRDERVKDKILRIFKIWEQREIYNEEYLSDLSGLLNIAPPKKSQVDVSDEFQNATLIAQVRECVELAETTDKSMQKLPKPPTFEIEVIKQQLKDKSHSGDIEKEVERCVAFINAYNKNLQNEIKSRKAVLASIEAAKKFYEHQGKEVKVVASAYKSFGTRIKIVKRKLDETIPNLASPIPSPDVNAPSPERDADLQLPDENNLPIQNLFGGGLNGFTSYLDGGKLPFDINDFKRDSKDRGSAIEVIGSRSDDEAYVPSANFYKPEAISSSDSSSIPGLGGSAEYTPNPPLFGSSSQEQYVPPPPSHLYGGNGNGGGSGGQDNQYTPAPMPPPPLPPSLGPSGGSADDFNSTWNMSMSWTPLDSSLNSSGASSSSYANQSTPHSPPHFDRKGNSAAAPIEYNEHLHTNSAALGAEDVDHRTLQLPPAFDFGAKLGLSKDKSRQLVDIDHRNLISLTGSPGGAEKDFAGGDVDYRIVPNPSDEGIMAPPGNNYAKNKTSSPLKSNASSSSESDRVDGAARYDPADMVIDMDMSDDDIDDTLREPKEDNGEADPEANGALTPSRPVLLETPAEFINPWETNNSFMGPPLPDDEDQQQQQQHEQQQQELQQHHQQHQHQQQQPPWNQMNPMQMGGGGAPPPPRPPYGPPFPPFQRFPGPPMNGPDGMQRGRGRGRGWNGPGPGPFRPPYQRMPGPGFDGPGPGPRPFFPRGGGPGGPMRGRGRMRGKAWMM
ncbi:regulation of nuclear pre-mRNA domain-containing protein 2 isoform X2 [Drosophila takahashii]|uniref:regulation of nuclear pre-mRNA domain-containing protein 2 isoform X2 n=1 Tax=Drosophila takahashii TaxID=29030 RepID=UPI0038991BC7